MEIFTDRMLRALSAWQRGWNEDQARKAELAKALKEHTANLALRFRSVDSPCYRKRYVHHGELVDLLLKDNRDEGMASWTTDQRYAERFKGLKRDNAISAAVYCHMPSPEEVILNVGELWRCKEFIGVAEAFRERCPEDAKALFNFRDKQSEVVLLAPLKGSEIVALSGSSSTFDELCDADGVPEEERDALYRKLIDSGVYPGDPMLTYAAPDVISRTILKFHEKLEQLKNTHSHSTT